MLNAFHKIPKLYFLIFPAFLLLTAAVAKKQTYHNQITVRGAVEPAQAKAMVAYYAQHWNLDSLHILVQYTTMSKNLKGYTQYIENKRWKVRQVIIRINRLLSVKEQWLTLTHEMVHVKQFRRGELIAHGGATYTWKNHHHVNIDNITYHNRAWEKEAFRLEKKLYRKYQQSQRLIARR